MKPSHKTWLIVGAAIALGFVPLLIPFFKGQWARSEYQAFPLMIGAIGFFLWSRWQVAPTTDRKHWTLSVIAWLATLSAFVNLGLAMFFYSPWLAMIAFVFFALAFAINVWQRWAVAGIFMIWILVCLLVPPPLDRDRMFVAKLRLFSSSLTSKILDGIGVLHVLNGNVFDLPKTQSTVSPPIEGESEATDTGIKSLFVDEACSGVVSLVSIMTCIAIYVVWQQRSLFHFVLLLAFGSLWVIFMNTIRLASIAVAWYWWEFDLSEGNPHMLLGMVMFAISAAVVYCVDQWLNEFLAPIDISWRERDDTTRKTGLTLMKVWNAFFAAQREGVETDESKGRSLQPAKLTGDAQMKSLLAPTSSVGWPVLAILALAGAAQITLVAPSEASLQAAIKAAKERAIVLTKEFDPLKDSNERPLELIKFDVSERDKFDAWGEFSRAFEYQSEEGQTYQVSLDFPFGPHWHDLRDCYRGIGGQITEEKFFVMDVKLDEAAAPRLGTGRLTDGWEADEFLSVNRHTGRTHFVVHCAFYADGKIFNRPRGGSLFYDFVTHVAKGRDRQEQADYFQVQVVVYSPEGVTPEVQEEVRKLIGFAAERFRSQIAEMK